MMGFFWLLWLNLYHLLAAMDYWLCVSVDSLRVCSGNNCNIQMLRASASETSGNHDERRWISSFIRLPGT